MTYLTSIPNLYIIYFLQICNTSVFILYGKRKKNIFHSNTFLRTFYKSYEGPQILRRNRYKYPFFVKLAKSTLCWPLKCETGCYKTDILMVCTCLRVQWTNSINKLRRFFSVGGPLLSFWWFFKACYKGAPFEFTTCSGSKMVSFTLHYAPETFKMWS